MKKRRTILETLRPKPVEFGALARRWQADYSVRMLSWLWSAYDRLAGEILVLVDWDQAEDDLERSITELLEIRIRDCMPVYCPVYVQHEPKERETRRPAPAQPKEYDIAFVLRENERTMWPLEAKLLRNDSRIANYVHDIQNEFLTCSYAPFSSEAGMLGYLLTGDADTALDNIAAALGVPLTQHPEFPDRSHRISEHTRNCPPNRTCLPGFRCQHLMMMMSNG